MSGPPAMPHGHDPRGGHPIPSLYGTQHRPGEHPRHPLRRHVGQLVRRYRVHWAVASLVLYAVALGVLLAVLPQVSNLTVSMLLLASGFLNGVSALGALLDDE